MLCLEYKLSKETLENNENSLKESILLYNNLLGITFEKAQTG
jgi:hypothetical protein